MQLSVTTIHLRPLLLRLSPVWLAVSAALIIPRMQAAALSYGYDGPARRDRPLYVVYLENDMVAGTDRHYTNGLKFSWFSPEVNEWTDSGWLGELAESLPVVNQPGGLKSFGFALGQNIYTPQDITRTAPDPQDRPYAG